MEWKHTLKENRLRVTPARMAVLELLEKKDAPMDIQAILAELSASSIPCDQVTVYRMMETFVEKGMVKQVNFEDGKFRYEIEGEHHHHLVCEQCGSIQAIHDPCLAVSETEVKQKYNFQITRHHLEFFGLCQSCANL
jgi:Fur family transcriptional regulator, ferric uptake regulator